SVDVALASGLHSCYTHVRFRCSFAVCIRLCSRSMDGDHMKIVSVDVLAVSVPVSVPLKNSFQSKPRNEYSRIVVRVEADNGLIGLGETWCGIAVRNLVTAYGKLLIGTSPFEIESL